STSSAPSGTCWLRPEGRSTMTEHRSSSSAATAARYVGALALLAVGIDHIEQYYGDFYRAIPTIGTLFVLNFISALIVGLVLRALPRDAAAHHLIPRKEVSR